jgi:ATPase family associated with various cellular activities (AAA)
MELVNVLAGGAAFGVVAGFWDKIKAALWKGVSFFVQRVEIPSEQAHDAVVAYLIAHYPRSRFYDRMYGATHEYQRDGRYGLIPYELFGNRSVLFWDGWRPFVFSNERENQAKNSRGGRGEERHSDATKVYSTLTFVRGTVDVEAILRNACDGRNKLSWAVSSAEEQAKNRFVIHHIPSRGSEEDEHGYDESGLPWYQQASYRLLSHAPEQLGKRPTHNGTALGNLIFPQRIKDLIKEIELWRNNRAWYFDKGIPWKRGWLLYGPPGTGKTALARAFAEDLNLPIYVFNLAEISNHELIKAWSDMQVNVPCIALIEDIDNVFHGRENVARKNGLMPLFFSRRDGNDGDHKDRPPFTPLTFDCLLNCLDGVERSDGVFTIITTNDIAKVDPALGQPRKLPDGTVEFISTRPGRIDKAVELTHMEPADKKRMAERILGEYPEEYRAMLEFIDKYPDLQETPAQFQERCGQIALACFWKQQQVLLSTMLIGGWQRPARVEEPDEMLVGVGR